MLLAASRLRELGAANNMLWVDLPRSGPGRLSGCGGRAGGRPRRRPRPRGREAVWGLQGGRLLQARARCSEGLLLVGREK